jgi:Domain of unknown function (DUF4062)
MKIYISSTYQDLVDHRAAVDRTLRRMGHNVIGMEQYVAEGSKPVERCKNPRRTTLMKFGPRKISGVDLTSGAGYAEFYSQSDEVSDCEGSPRIPGTYPWPGVHISTAPLQ